MRHRAGAILRDKISPGSNLKVMCHISVCLLIMGRASRMKCYQRSLNVLCRNREVTNEDVGRNIQAAIGEYGETLALHVKKRKLSWCGHVFMSSGIVKDDSTGKGAGPRSAIGRAPD